MSSTLSHTFNYSTYYTKPILTSRNNLLTLFELTVKKCQYYIMKKALKVILISFIFLFFVLFLLFYLDRKNNPAKYSLYNSVNVITEKRYQEGKVFEVILKEEVTDREAKSVLDELYKIRGVNGSTLYTREIQKIGDYSFLFPQDVISIEPESRVVIDLFVKNLKDKKSIIEQVKNNPKVEVVLDLISQ